MFVALDLSMIEHINVLHEEDEDLCGPTAKHVEGWFGPEEFADAFPKISKSRSR